MKSVRVMRGNRLGKPFAVYAADAHSRMTRRDYATLAEARAVARALSTRTGWQSREEAGLDKHAKAIGKRGSAPSQSAASMLKPFAGLLQP